MKKLLILATLAILTAGKLSGQKITRDTIDYKIIGKDTLSMIVVKPAGWENRTDIPAMVFFFGGGWNSGTYGQFFPQAKVLAKKGMVVFLPDYRVRSRQGTTPFESLSDAKSAMRFVRGHSEMLHIDESRIAAGGGSAGGHLAAACACISKYDNYGDNLNISPKPDLLVLFNPVIDNSPDGYGYDRVKDDYIYFSPMHNITEKFPDTIIMSGDKDKIVSVHTLESFRDKVSASGADCELHIFKNASHGFFNKTEKTEEFYNETVELMVNFMTRKNYITK